MTTMPVLACDVRPHAAALPITGVRILLSTPTMTYDLWVYESADPDTASLDVRVANRDECSDEPFARIDHVVRLPGTLVTRQVAVIARSGRRRSSLSGGASG